PWAPAGAYTVQLTVNGKRYTQPLRLYLDPRVRTPAPALAELAALTHEMYLGARAAHQDAVRAHALAAALTTADGEGVAGLRAALDSIAPAPRPEGRRGFRGRRNGAKAAPTLDAVSGEMLGAAMAMQEADVAPTAENVAACARARADAAEVLRKWNALVDGALPRLNARRKAAGLPAVTLPRD
ncbi:MAG TPA: hypothetical protein VFU45_03055, partial [Gemmatimonadales bacterium]|nr:hypothetical protein [Gemmatimonadales bacterium]